MPSEYDKRAAIVVALRAGRSTREISEFLGLPKDLVHRTKRSYDASENLEEFCPSRKKHARRSDAKRDEEFVASVAKKIDENPGKPHFFEPGVRLNADSYVDVLTNVVKPWMDEKANGRDYVFQQDSAPAHKARETQSWLHSNVPHHWSPDLWPPSSPDCNPLDFYVWGVVEREVNKVRHASLDDVKAAVTKVMSSLSRDIVAKACASFRGRLEAVVAAEGGYIEHAGTLRSS